MQIFSLYVRDMTCSDCSNVVKQQLERVPGVCHVNVNLTEGSATVYYKELSHALEEMQLQVNNLGYLGCSQLVPNHQCKYKSHTSVHNGQHVVSVSNNVDSMYFDIQPDIEVEEYKLTDIAKQAGKLLKQLFSSVNGNIRLRLWNGETFKLGNAADGKVDPSFTLIFRSSNAVRSMVLGRDPLRFAEAYFCNDIDIEGDFFAALTLKDHLHSIRLSMLDKMATAWSALCLTVASEVDSTLAHSFQARPAESIYQTLHAKSVKEHSKTENREAIAFHYDISNEFYALWLDQSMVYSCAYFERTDYTLEQAQLAKLDHICRKLLLKPGEKLLDIGCGWGALIIHAAKHYGVIAHGITLSERQFGLANQRIADAGLQGQVTVELIDYRDLKGENFYDKISSIGMFEHIGLKNLPVYFSAVNRLLKPAGLFLNHGITHFDEGWNKSLSTEFINRYVFPDGQLDTVSNIQVHMEHAKFEIADVESLRPHYALTLRHWVARLEQHHEQALQYVNEATYRIWRLYMAACALEFESGEIGVYQILASKIAGGTSLLPLTRRHMYLPADK